MYIDSEKFTACIRTIRQNDDDFILTNGIVVTPRAGFEISNRCPENYKDLIHECIRHGWIKPVAYMYDHELMWEKLSTPTDQEDPYPTPW
jgi:hypothetical protein